jgi:hypothetical protein
VAGRLLRAEAFVVLLLQHEHGLQLLRQRGTPAAETCKVCLLLVPTCMVKEKNNIMILSY